MENRLSTYSDLNGHSLGNLILTSLYKETGDIYLVADVLGHKDVNTTKRHYAALEEDIYYKL